MSNQLHNESTPVAQRPAVVVDQTPIHQDEQGRFCVNDLHQSAGGLSKHRPSLWLRQQSVRELALEIERQGNDQGVEFAAVFSQKGGAHPGTYVCRELVYAYAAWISPQFHLKVLRAYDAMMTSSAPIRSDGTSITVPNFNDPVVAARAWADEREMATRLANMVRAREQALQEAAPAIEFFDSVQASEDTLSLGEFAKLMGVGQNAFFAQLRNDNVLICARNRFNLPYQHHINAKRFEVQERVVKNPNGSVRIFLQTRVTPKGQAWLQQRYFPKAASNQNLSLPLPVPEQSTEALVQATPAKALTACTGQSADTNTGNADTPYVRTPQLDALARQTLDQARVLLGAQRSASGPAAEPVSGPREINDPAYYDALMQEAREAAQRPYKTGRLR